MTTTTHHLTPDPSVVERLSVTPATAGWKYLSFAVLGLGILPLGHESELGHDGSEVGAVLGVVRIDPPEGPVPGEHLGCRHVSGCLLGSRHVARRDSPVDLQRRY